jgi:tRNA threonylcarbamoyladenosine biosynthesis protein TsaE
LEAFILEQVVEGEKATVQLGAGKTCLVRGLARGLTLDEDLVASPSFSLINEYPGPLPLFHMDCYRLHLDEEIEELGLEEYFDGPGITVIEWAERIKDLPEDRLDISLTILGETERHIRISPYGKMVRRMKAAILDKEACSCL